jgi:hypothetical protein
MSNPTRRNNQIFISYRREDNAGVTGRIYDRLVQQFGETAIFKDIDSIPLGVNFRQHIDTIVQECDVVLVVIGDRWAGETKKPVRRRIDNPEDIVRIEIESALNRNIRVIPLLIQGVTMPSEAFLPDSLKGLAIRHGITIGNDPHFHSDMERLIRDLGLYFDSLACNEKDSTLGAKHLQPGPSISDASKAENASLLPQSIQEKERPTNLAEDKTVKSTSIRKRSVSWPGVLGYVLALVIAAGFLVYEYSHKTKQTSVESPAQLATQDELRTALRDAKSTIRAAGFLVQAVDPDLIIDKTRVLPDFKAEILMVDPLNVTVVCKRQEDEGNHLTYGKSLLKLRIFHHNLKNLLGNRLKVGVTDAYPTMSVIMIDDDLYAYFYSYNKPGTDSPVLKFTNYAKDARAKFFVDHYNNLRSTARQLVQDADFEKYDQADMNFKCPPAGSPVATSTSKDSTLAH